MHLFAWCQGVYKKCSFRIIFFEGNTLERCSNRHCTGQKMARIVHADDTRILQPTFSFGLSWVQKVLHEDDDDVQIQLPNTTMSREPVETRTVKTNMTDMLKKFNS